MPVRLGSKLPAEQEARIEIIPLIDIMFFLLAAFMLVSLSMVKVKGVKVQLPTATQATSETRNDFLSVSVDESGAAFVDRQAVGRVELSRLFASRLATNAALRVIISADRNARHGDIIQVLDLARSVGIEKVAFEIRSETGASSP